MMWCGSCDGRCGSWKGEKQCGEQVGRKWWVAQGGWWEQEGEQCVREFCRAILCHFVMEEEG